MSIIDPILDIPMISRIRRNHGLEHASLHILANRHPGVRMGGYSDFNGFWLLGELSVEQIRLAVEEALIRMKAGEHNLAVHPNCGTNFATAGSLAGFAGIFGMWGVGDRKRDKIERLPMVAAFATLALILAQPLGLKVQQHITTSGYPGKMEVADIFLVQRRRIKAHRVLTRG